MLLVVGICIGDVFVLVANLIFETSLWYFFIQSYFVSVFIARNSGKKFEVPGMFFSVYRRRCGCLASGSRNGECGWAVKAHKPIDGVR